MIKLGILMLLLLLVTVSANDLDIWLLREIHSERNTNWDLFNQCVSNSISPVTICIPLILYGFGAHYNDSAMIQKSLFISTSILSAAALTTTLKYSVHRTRPFVTYPDLEKKSYGGSPSFPSGHTSSAFSVATSTSMAYPKWYVAAPLFLWAGAVGYSRMNLGVHYPSDVFVGAVLGICSGYLSYKGRQWLSRKRRNNLVRPALQ